MPTVLRVMLQAFGAVVVVVTIVGSLAALWLRAASAQPVDAMMVVTLVITFVIGVAAGGVLLAAGTMIRRASTSSAHQTNKSFGAIGDEGSGTFPGAGGGGVSSNGSPDATPCEIGSGHLFNNNGGDFAWLNPDDRPPARQRLHSCLIRQSAEAVIAAINRRQLAQARLIMRQAEARFGSATMLQRLDANIEETARRNEPLDYAHTRRIVEGHIGAGNWAQAEEAASRLCAEHPPSARCKQLWDDTRRGRLHAHIQACGTARHWAEALAATEEFLDRFAQSVEAEALRSQVETIRINVEIEQRRHYEDRFRELIAVQKFDDALRLARVVVQRFPGSPQAAALRPQIALLEQRMGAASGD